MAPTIVPKAQRQQQSRVLRTKAPLAAQFEDCVQLSIRLTDAIQANRVSSNQLRQLAWDCHNEMRIWGDDSGATSRTLDYALKCAPKIARQTESLLADLLSVLEMAVASVRFYDDNSDDSADDIPSSSREANSSAFQDSKHGTDARLAEAFDVLACLIRMLPAYHNAPDEHESPRPDDNLDRGLNGLVSADSYIQAAADFFPAASKDLLNRLGNSNWRRQRCLHHLQSRVDATSVGGGSAASALEATPPPQNGGIAYHPTVGDFGASRLSTWTASSSKTATTVNTRITSIMTAYDVSDHNSATSLTGSQQTFLLPQLTPPQPPVPLPTDRQFQCHICQFELPLAVSAPGVTHGDWNDHVFLDLKPYLCTFDNCSWESTLFGVKEDWFQHELDFHRSPTTWLCPCCLCDSFDDESRLCSHIASMHKDQASQLTALAENSKRYSRQEPLLDCRLCLSSCSDLCELRDHVGSHLENFALHILPQDETILPDDQILEDYTNLNVRDYLADLSDEEGPQVKETKTIRASSPPAAAKGSVPWPPPTEGSMVADTNDVSIPDDPDTQSPHLRDPSRPRWIRNARQVVEDKVSYFIEQARRAAPVQQEPQMSNVPPRDEKFFGRDIDLDRMHESLSQMGRICTVTGRGGIGKTATAKEYLHRFRDEYSFIFWVDAESPGVLQRQYLAISEILDAGDVSLHDESNRIIFVRECLSQSQQRWLLALDNVTNWLDIVRYIPKGLTRTRGSALVTMRGTEALTVPPMYIQDHIHLDPWSVGHSRQFLLTSIDPTLEPDRLQEHPEYHLAEDVVEKVDRLPLAVNMVVGYITVSRSNLQDFLEMWEEKTAARRRPKTTRKTGAGIDPTIDSLWEIGIGEVRANCRKLLDVLSFFGSETIPKSLLVGEHDEDYLNFLHPESNLRYNRMISQLDRQKLIEIKEENGEPAYSIHRVLQEKIQNDFDRYSFADAFRKAFRLIRKKFPKAEPTQVPVPENLDVCRKYMPHVDSFYVAYERYSEEHGGVISLGDVEPVEVAELLYDAAFFVWGGQSTAFNGPPYLEAAERILEEKKVEGNKKLRADINCIYGLLLLNMGYVQRAFAARRLEQAWEIRKDLYDQKPVVGGIEDVLSRSAANDFCICLMHEYRFEEAQVLLLRCRERYRLWGSAEEHPFEYSKFYGNYTVVLLWEGRFEEAIDSCHKCLELTERFGGKRSQYYRRLFFLGCIYLQAGDLQKALDTHLDALKQRIVLQGLYHEDTMMSMYAVGAMFHYLGDVASAIDYIRQCIKRAKNVQWPHEAFGKAQHHLALIYEKRGAEGDKEEAEALRRESTQILDHYRIYTPQHIVDTGDEMMIFDDLVGTFSGRYTGRHLLKHIQARNGKTREGSGSETHVG